MAIQRGPKIVTSGLVLALDAANRNSYPGSGTTWYDLSSSKNTAILNNGPVFNRGNGGYFSFDGADDILSMTNNTTVSTSTGFSVCVWLQQINPQFNVNTWSYFYAENDFQMGTYYSTSADKYFLFDRYSGGSVSYVFSANIADSWSYLVYGTNSSRQPYVHTYNSTGYSYSTDTRDIGSYNINFSSFFRATGLSGARSYKANCAALTMYNRKLTDIEVQQNYNATRARFGL